jgi:hypothetical protein
MKNGKMKNGKIYEVNGEFKSHRWYLNGKLHREDGPAIEDENGSTRWFLNGKMHREDGPAFDCSDGRKYWYFNDEYISNNEEEFTHWNEKRKLNEKLLSTLEPKYVEKKKKI